MKLPTSLVQTTCPSPWGPLLLAASAQGLAGVWFEGQQHHPAEQARPWAAGPAHPVLQAAVSQLQAYFAGQRQHFDVPLDLSAGTTFQQAVWQALLAIPHGATASYGAISQRIGRATAVRAVGGAIGRNPLSIVVPCHRVMGQGGGLTGYAGGLDRKRGLLELEGAL